MPQKDNDGVLDWEDLSPKDQQRVNDMLKELNEIFKQYTEREEPCDDSTSSD
jgi:hypothetical protein